MNIIYVLTDLLQIWNRPARS